MFSGYKIISDGNLISLGIGLEELDHVTSFNANSEMIDVRINDCHTSK